jgi:hypothetical protein
MVPAMATALTTRSGSVVAGPLDRRCHAPWREQRLTYSTDRSSAPCVAMMILKLLEMT